MPASPLRRTATRVLIVAALSTLAALTVAEWTARRQHPWATHERLLAGVERNLARWQRPHPLFHHVGDDAPFRPALPDPARLDPARPRLLIVGDSFVMGHGVDGGERFGDLLSAALPDGYAVDVLAVSSYSPLIYLNLIREALGRAEYRRVLLHIDQTDPVDDLIYRNDLAGETRRLTRRFDVARMSDRDAQLAVAYGEMRDGLQTLPRRLALYNVLRPLTVLDALAPDSVHRRYVELSLRRGELVKHFSDGPEDTVRRTMEQFSLSVLDEIVALCAAAELPLAIATNPWQRQLRQDPTGNRLQAAIETRYAATPGVATISLAEAFRQDPQPATLFLDAPGEFHWNARGHALVALVWLAFLQSSDGVGAARAEP